MKNTSSFIHDREAPGLNVCILCDRSQVLVTFLAPNKIDVVTLRGSIELLETVDGIGQGFEGLNPGQTRAGDDFVQEIKQN